MENDTERPVEAHRNTPKDARNHPARPFDSSPLPYYPALKREIQTVAGALGTC